MHGERSHLVTCPTPTWKRTCVTLLPRTGTKPVPPKWGLDEMSVVDSNLKVYGVERLRIADGSIMPRITTGNTMAPCMVIGERAADIIKAAYGI